MIQYTTLKDFIECTNINQEFMCEVRYQFEEFYEGKIKDIPENILNYEFYTFYAVGLNPLKAAHMVINAKEYKREE